MSENTQEELVQVFSQAIYYWISEYLRLEQNVLVPRERTLARELGKACMAAAEQYVDGKEAVLRCEAGLDSSDVHISITRAITKNVHDEILQLNWDDTLAKYPSLKLGLTQDATSTDPGHS